MGVDAVGFGGRGKGAWPRRLGLDARLFILAVERSQCSVIPGSLRHPICYFPNDLTLTSASSVPGLPTYADSQRLRSRRPSLGGEDDGHRQRLAFGEVRVAGGEW